MYWFEGFNPLIAANWVSTNPKKKDMMSMNDLHDNLAHTSQTRKMADYLK
jgi:hypothetical protein